MRQEARQMLARHLVNVSDDTAALKPSLDVGDIVQVFALLRSPGGSGSPVSRA